MYRYNSVAERMQYIQNLFLEAGTLVDNAGRWKEQLPFLEKEAAEYRSVAYEGFSFVLALKELNASGLIGQWKEFRKAAQQHPFHVDIGLGWALAKKELPVHAFVDTMDSLSRSMVLDGIGYYCSLFRGRSTLKNKDVPAAVEEKDLGAFDQGVGRRLWYMAKGNVKEAANLLYGFPSERQGNLFRGIGIACAYVGGCSEEDLMLLNALSRDHEEQLQLGVVLGSFSRILSNSVTPSVERAYQIICRQPSSHLDSSLTSVTKKFLYLYNNCENDSTWFARFRSDLLQTWL